MIATHAPITKVAHQTAVAQRAAQIVEEMYDGDPAAYECLWQYIEGMLDRVRANTVAAQDAIDDMTISDVMAAAASVRAQSRVEAQTIEEMERKILEEMREGE